jgi:hypothetical protein
VEMELLMVLDLVVEVAAAQVDLGNLMNHL